MRAGIGNQIKRWNWQAGKNTWTSVSNLSPEKMGTVIEKSRDLVLTNTYLRQAVPFGQIVCNYAEKRRVLIIQNKDAANNAFISFGSRDSTEPNYLPSLLLLPGQTFPIFNNCPVDDVYGACTVAAASVLLSISEGLLSL